MLVIDSRNRETKQRCVEDSYSILFSQYVDAYYLAASHARGRPPVYLFEREDGDRKSPCYASSMIASFTKAAGAALPPTALRERQVENRKRRHKLNDEALRDLVGASTHSNARRRYTFLDQLNVAEEFARGSINDEADENSQ